MARHCFIGPEIAMEIQATLGSDIAMVFDECPPHACEHEYAARSLELHAPLGEALHAAARARQQSSCVFGIVQGATFADLRRAERGGAGRKWTSMATQSAE